jgi:arabinose-5-phosphate isomerase
MQEVLFVMTEKSFGVAGVVDDAGELLGVITDGDLRRHSSDLFTQAAGQIMTRDPKVVGEGVVVEDALALMNAHRITAMFVMAHDNPRVPVGLVHIHDFVRMGLR